MASDVAERPSKIPTYAEIQYPVFDFSGGLNTKSTNLFINRTTQYALKPNQVVMLENLVRTASGGLVTRPGRVKVNSTALAPSAGDTEVRDIAELRTSTGVDRIICHAGNTLYRLDSGNTWTAIYTLATENTRIHWAQFKDVLVGVDGSNTPIYYDGTTVGTISGLPSTTTVICAFRTRLWAIDGVTLRYSADGSYSDWTSSGPAGAGTITITTARGQRGTGLIGFWDRLLITTNNQCYQMFGVTPGTFTLAAINFRYGHEGSPYSLLAAGNDVYMMTKRGMVALSVAFSQSETGDVVTDYISGAIEPTWQDITPSNFTNMVAVDDTMHNCLLILCNKTGATNNQAMVADYYHRDAAGNPTWAEYTNFSFSSIAQVTSLNSFPEILMGSYDGYVYRQSDSATTDDGTNLLCRFRYLTDLEAPTWQKLWRHLVFYADAPSGSATLISVFDFGQRTLSQSFTIPVRQGDTIGGTFTIGVSPLGSTSFNSTRLSIPGPGRFASLFFSASLSVKVTFGGFIIYAGLRRMIQ